MYNDTRLTMETLTVHKTGILEVTANCYFFSPNFKLFPHTSHNIYPKYKPNDGVVPGVGKDLMNSDNETEVDRTKGSVT
jgi:hypothetical protein